MNIKGNKITVQKTQEETFNFLSELKNFEQLMPDSIQKFEVDGDSFVFGLKGMPEIRLVLKYKTPFSKVVLGAASSKFSFQLVADIAALTDASSEVEIVFDCEFNKMMEMMVKKPLTSFIETLTANLSKV